MKTYVSDILKSYEDTIINYLVKSLIEAFYFTYYSVRTHMIYVKIIEHYLSLCTVP